MLTMKTDFHKILGKVKCFHSNLWEALNREIEKNEKLLDQILTICWQQKYKRDIDVREKYTIITEQLYWKWKLLKRKY